MFRRPVCPSTSPVSLPRGRCLEKLRSEQMRVRYLDVEPTHLYFVKDPWVIVIITKVENH